MAVFSNKQILKAIKDGHIVCVPFNPRHVSHASLDVTLGNYYYRTERSKDHPVYNPFDEGDVKRYFEGAIQATPHKKWCDENGIKMLKGIPANHLVIPVRPGERILTHTHEFFGIRPPGACEVRSRSSWGRNGVAVSFDAGWIDPGYINRLTLEVFNLNHNEIILLPVGERIAQIIFHETGEVAGNYGQGRHGGMSGKYKSGTDLKKLIKNWRPEMMLPRAYLDKRASPKPIKGLKVL
ncbi:MAG: dCTP deaminase [Candidatus Saccharimonadales bacterium]